ncbi:MAG: hypothetical protein RLY86_66, partial [Pseudomonadota bacterium]
MTDTPAPQSATAQAAAARREERGSPIGHRLLALGLIGKDQLEIALQEKARSRKMLGTILVEFGFITEDTLSAVLSESMGIARFDAKSTVIDAETARLLPKETAQACRSILIAVAGGVADVAMVDPYDVLAIDQIRRLLPAHVQVIPRVCTPADLAEAIDRAYGYEMSIDGILKELQTGRFDQTLGTEEGYTHPVIRLVNAILMDAVKVGASDLHFEPEALFLRLRYRIDGAMHQIRAFHKDLWPAVAHRLKIIAGMNIADKLSPQDGRFSLRLGSREVDFRAAALPTIHGENIVLRVLDKTKSLKSLDQLGFSDHNRAQLELALKRPEGIIIVTGPTGSGKTTTLYGMLSLVSRIDVNLMTLEDPVEYQLPLIRQTQIREQTGLRFGEGVRALLRQDPDIIFIGEVRDAETAQMALRAAMTGHQVFTTLHTNDAIGAFPRLFDLGLQPPMIAGSIIAVLAQRLVRTLCTSCRRPRPATAEECRILGASPGNPPVIHEAVGCKECRHTGYRGRVAVAEVLLVDELLDEAIARGAGRAEVRSLLRRQGFRSIVDDGLAK